MSRDMRLQMVLRHLNDHGHATVQDLSRMLAVSAPTVYRDIRELVRRNLVRLKNGQVLLCNEQAVVTPLYHRNETLTNEKQKIAEAATKLLHDNMVIFLDASSTAFFLVKHLDRFSGLIVLTNGLVTAMELRENGINTVCVGGVLIENSLSTCGKIAYDTVNKYDFDVAFFSAQAVTPNGIIADASEYESALRKLVIQRADVTAFLCDHSKFGKTSTFRVAMLRDIDYLITNHTITKEKAPVKKEIIVAT